MKCYQCKQLDQVQEHYPFCSKLCHEMWSNINYPKVFGNKFRNIQEAIQRAKELGQGKE